MNPTIKTLTLIAAIVSAGLVGLFHWWFQSPYMLTGAYTLITAVAVFSLPVSYHLFGYANIDSARALLQLEAAEYQQLIDRIDKVEDELQALDIVEGKNQAHTLNHIINDYHSVIETRFAGKKHSPVAYLSAARTVQKQALQNLVDMVAIGHSLSSIARNRSEPAPGKDPEPSRQAKHASLYDEQLARVDALLEENRKLFDALTDTAVEVANMQSFNQYQRIDTIARLIRLAELANQSGQPNR